MPVYWNQLIPTRRSLLSRLKHWDDQKSWQDFYEIYHRLIFGGAIKAGLTETEAQDFAQETAAAVAKAIVRRHSSAYPSGLRFVILFFMIRAKLLVPAICPARV